jgi:uncharacterized protein
MFRVDLVALEKAGHLSFQREIPEQDSLWEGSILELSAPVAVDVRLSVSGTGQVLARGTLDTRVHRECRRCLEPVTVPVHVRVDLVWSVPDEFGEDDGEIRLLDPVATELDLGEVLREELVLASPVYALCREDCRGLCPRCGLNRNEEQCDCVLDEPDPRWEALRTLKTE